MTTLTLNLAIHTEKIHRHVFDNIYIQSKTKKNIKEKIILKYYKWLCKINPEFRTILKEANTQKPTKRLNKTNTDRYS